MLSVHLADLRDARRAWLGVSVILLSTTFAITISALVWAVGLDGLAAHRYTWMDANELLVMPPTNMAFCALVALGVVSSATRMVVDSRRGSIARLAVAGATPGQVVRTVMFQLGAVVLACAVVADVVAVALLHPTIDWLMTVHDPEVPLTRPEVTVSPSAMLQANAVVLLLCLLAGWGQARRASKIDPVEALREAVAPPGDRMTWRRWIGAALCLAVVGGCLGFIQPMAREGGKEAMSQVMQTGVLCLLLTMSALSSLSPLVVGPLAKGWTALLPLPSPVWQLARTNITVRGARFARSVVPVLFTIGLMAGLMMLAPTVLETTRATLGPENAIQLGAARTGDFLVLLGLPLGVALCGGVGSLLMMSAQRDAELSLLGITGATPAQRQAMPLVEALILTVTAALMAAVAVAVFAVVMTLGFRAAGAVPRIVLPLGSAAVATVFTLAVLMLATWLPTQKALREPEPRVVARLAGQ